MPEYLAPGVYLEETSFRAKSVEGVSTTTTGFIGACRYGPITLVPDLLTSLGDFERTYGDRLQMQFTDAKGLHNYLWHGVRAFFEEGGRRIYVSRIFSPDSSDPTVLYQRPTGSVEVDSKTGNAGRTKTTSGTYLDGHARQWLFDGAVADLSTVDLTQSLQIRARFPGLMGNYKIKFDLRAGRNILSLTEDGSVNLATSLQNYDVVWIGDMDSPISASPGGGKLFVALKNNVTGAWQFFDDSGSPTPVDLNTLIFEPVTDNGIAVHIVTLNVSLFDEQGGGIDVWAGLPVDSRHNRSGVNDSLLSFFTVDPANALNARQLPVVILGGSGVSTGLEVLEAIFGNKLDKLILSSPPASLLNETPGQILLKGLSNEVNLSGGNDGKLPSATEFEGTEDADALFKTGLKQFEDIEDISIVAAPGSSANYNSRATEARAVMGLLISHAERMRYRIAVLDSGDQLTLSGIRDLRAKMDSKYAAIYYPWIRILDPVTRSEINIPPSGCVAGIYARNDVNRAVYKAPANEVVNLALGFENMLNQSQQEVLNPEGINCFRYFEGRGMLLWGARTISSDPEWKYVNLRRYFAYLERSIYKGTQWAVFEPNGEQLWANVRRTIEDFLLNEWQSGALLGDKPEKAYFVKCDRSTMSQNDLDNGRLVCLIGVAAVSTAEMIIFRIGQWTGDQKI